MTLQIQRAVDGEESLAISFYADFLKQMEDKEYKPAWTYGIYPTDEEIIRAVRRGELYYAAENEQTVGAFILNDQCGTGYEKVKWEVDTNKVAVLHLLAVHPTVQRKGVGKMLLHKATDVCRENDIRALRLDTLPWNKPGRKMYETFGFHHCGDIELTYPSTGKIAFCMYELEICK